MNGNTEQLNGDEDCGNYCLSNQKQLLCLSECIKQLSDSYVEVCSNQDVGFKILQTAMQSEVFFVIDIISDVTNSDFPISNQIFSKLHELNQTYNFLFKHTQSIVSFSSKTEQFVTLLNIIILYYTIINYIMYYFRPIILLKSFTLKKLVN